MVLFVWTPCILDGQSINKGNANGFCREANACYKTEREIIEWHFTVASGWSLFFFLLLFWLQLVWLNGMTRWKTGSITRRSSKRNTGLYMAFSLLICCHFFPLPFSTCFPLSDLSCLHFCTDWLSRLGLGNQVGSTTDHLANCYLPSTL